MSNNYCGYPLTTQTAAYTGTSGAISNAVGAQVHKVRLIATSDCHVAFGASPTATTSDFLLIANQVEYFTIHPGQKVAAIQDSAAGTLYVTEMTQ